MSKDLGLRTDIVRKALNGFPYFVLKNEIKSGYSEYTQELNQIKADYVNYSLGSDFNAEGTSGDYLPSKTLIKNTKILIDKQARYIFSRPPLVVVSGVGTSEDELEQVETYQKIVSKIINKSDFSKVLLQSLKDCLIGKRVAGVVDYSEEDGAMIHFYNSLQFYYETEYGTRTISKMITFENVTRAKASKQRRYLVNRYEMIGDAVHFSSILYDGSGNIIESLIPETKTAFTRIPAVVITNDGLLEDTQGVSDVEDLDESESTYSMLSNADVDALRKGMNPIRYTVDMSPTSTKKLPSGAGSYWDLISDDNKNECHPQVGTLAPQLNHTEALKTTLDRYKTAMYQQVDVPNISEETMVGTITSGKTIEALYFPLTVRSDEKMMSWKPSLERLFEMALELVQMNRTDSQRIYEVDNIADLKYTIIVTQQYALLKDQNEEKRLDMEEIMANVRSRKSYLKKYRADELTNDDMIEEELMQIAMEVNMFDTMSMNTQVSSRFDGKQTEDQIEEDIEELETKEGLEETK